MKRYILFISMAVLFSLFACSSQDATGPLAVDFVHDYNKGLAMAKEQGKPIMLVFEADWCGACKELKSTVFTDKSVGEVSKRLVNISVNVDQDSESPNKYGVRYIPSIFFLDPSGKNAMPYQGPRTPENLIKIMNAFGDKYPS